MSILEALKWDDWPFSYRILGRRMCVMCDGISYRSKKI